MLENRVPHQLFKVQKEYGKAGLNKFFMTYFQSFRPHLVAIILRKIILVPHKLTKIIAGAKTVLASFLDHVLVPWLQANNICNHASIIKTNWWIILHNLSRSSRTCQIFDIILSALLKTFFSLASFSLSLILFLILADLFCSPPFC